METYDNLRLTQRNFEYVNGIFYSMDLTVPTKVLTGRDANSGLTRTININSDSNAIIKTLVHDGVDWWTLEDQYQGVIIKRWRVNSASGILETKDSFGFLSGTIDQFDPLCMAIEHYHYTLTMSYIAGASTIKISNTTGLKIGHNITLCSSLYLEEGGSVETRQVTSIAEDGTITLNLPLSKNYPSTTRVNTYNSIWFFNNKAPYGAGEIGCLYNINPYTGYIYSRQGSGVFKDVMAAIFESDLKFIKGNCLLSKDLYDNIYTSSMVMDNLESDNSTVIYVYDLTMVDEILYRLQDKATFLADGSVQTFDWTTKNFQKCILDKYPLSLCLTFDPKFLSTNEMANIRAMVRDQYNVGIQGKTINFNNLTGIGILKTVYGDPLTTGITDSYGIVSGIYLAQTGSGEVKISAQVTS